MLRTVSNYNLKDVADIFTDILWDFDGTLFNTYPSMELAFKKALEDDGIIIDDDTIYKLIKKSMMFAFEYFKDRYDLSDDFMKRVSFYDINAEKDLTPPFPFAKEICTEFIKNGGRNFIYTHRGSSIFDFLNHYDMENLFTDIVTIDHGLKRKPNPEGFLYIIDKHNIDKESMLAIGDRDIDMMAAKGAGIKCCFFNYENTGCSTEHEYEINSLRDLSALLGLQL